MKKQKKSTWGRIFEWAGLRKKSYILSVILAVLSALSGMPPFILAAYIIKGLLAGNMSLGSMLTACGLMALFWFIKQLLHAVSTTESHKATFYVLGVMRKRALDRLERMPLGDIKAYGSGDLKNILVERIDSIETTLAHILPEFSSNILTTVFMLIYVFVIDWRMGLAALATVPLGMVFYLGMMIDYKPNYERTVRATKALNDTAVEYIGGIEVIKVFGKVKGSYERFVEAAREAAYSYINWMQNNNLFFCLASTIVPATLLTVLPLGIHFVGSGSLSQTHFVLTIMLTLAVFEPIMICFSYTDSLGVLQTVMDEITGIIDARVLERPSEDEGSPKDYSISFEDVHFGYGEKEVLHGVSLSMKQGTVNALVGPSGSGKSTIAKLLASYWDVGSGTIRIGGVDIRKLSPETYHRLIAYVSQDNFLFDDTIMENIRMGRPEASDEDVITAAKACGCHAFIEGLEQGYQTVVGGSGSHLSGGERQRIAIARAMMKDAPIIILDEATSYTDPENEAVIQSSIARLTQGKTLIVIAHRLSTVADADQILVVHDGCIEDRGRHEELLARGGLYEKMWKAHISARDSAEQADDAEGSVAQKEQKGKSAPPDNSDTLKGGAVYA